MGKYQGDKQRETEGRGQKTKKRYTFTAPSPAELWRDNPQAAVALAKLAVMLNGRRDERPTLKGDDH